MQFFVHAVCSALIPQVTSFNDILQLVIVELIYKVCHANPSERARFIRCVYNLLNSTSPAVRYEAAGTLVTLSTAPTGLSRRHLWLAKAILYDMWCVNVYVKVK